MQKPPALAAFLEAHQRPLIEAGMECDTPADPALKHIVENLDLGHAHNGGEPDTEQEEHQMVHRQPLHR